MRRIVFHRMLSRLALAAALLLTTLPTLGRLALPAHPHLHSPQPVAMAMAHRHAPPASTTGTPVPMPPPHAHGLDCVYCALLVEAVPTACLALAVVAVTPVRPVPVALATPPPARATTPGLGARGPPAVA
jgi:hypothetical protein